MYDPRPMRTSFERPNAFPNAAISFEDVTDTIQTGILLERLETLGI